MNVLLAPNLYLPMLSGVPIFTQCFAQELRGRGHRVTIVTTRLHPSHPSYEQQDGIEIHRRPFAFPIRLLYQQSDERIWGCLRYGLLDLYRTVRIIRTTNAQVVHLHGLVGPYVPYLLAAIQFVHVPLVVTLHGREFVSLHGAHNIFRRTILRRTFRKAHRVTALTSCLLEEAKRVCPEVSTKLVRIPNGVYVDDIASTVGAPITQPYLLSIGRLNPFKGHDVLLAAFRTVAAHESNIHLVIAGDGPLRVRLQALALALGLRDRVTFLGEVPRERVQALLAGCEYFVLPSWTEGMPLVALEAMAHGKAVIGTEIAGFSEVVIQSETGLLIPPGDPYALADAMLSLMTDKEETTRMGKRGQEVVRSKFNFSHIVAQYLDVYEHVVQGYT